MRPVNSLRYGHRAWCKPSTMRGFVNLQFLLQDVEEHRWLRFGSPCERTITRFLSNNSSVNNVDSESKPAEAPTENSILSKESATAPIDYPTSQRVWALPPAIAIHLSIGSVYVYSMWTPGMTKALGASEVLLSALELCSMSG